MLPFIEEEFGSGYGVLGLAVAVGLLAYAAGSLVASPVMRLAPPRGLLLATFAVTGVGFVASAVASSPLSIAVAVVLLGLSAPISWTATLHMARETVRPASLALVSAAASGGAAVGVIVNGVLVRTSDGLHSWRVSFVLAAAAAGLAIVLVLVVFRDPIPRIVRSAQTLVGLFAAVSRDRSGRVIAVTSGVAGVAVFTLATFLTATAIDEMGRSATEAGLLFLVGGLVGASAALAGGRLGDRRAPITAIAIAMTTYTLCLALLGGVWTYPVLVVAVVGYGILNGPVWGLMGAMANRRFGPEMAVGAVALGLVSASLVGALGNSIAGFWIERFGSMREPVFGLALLAGLCSWYLFRVIQAEKAS